MSYPRMRDLREDADRTQQWVADYLHMQRSVYRRYELGQREVPAWVVAELSRLYRTSADYILGLRDEK